ncbi:MAG: hypothetical protein ACPKPY_02690 [Nitrososphaeraceae archaeon]
MDSDSERNDKYIKSWILEWNSSYEEFTDYLKAVDRFESKADEIDVLLYEIHKLSDNGKIVKKIPVLNSNKSRKKKKKIIEKMNIENKSNSTQEDKSKEPTKKKTTFKEIRIRIFILIGVVFFFIILLYILSQLSEHDPFDLHFLTFANSNLIYQYYSEIVAILKN